MTIASDGNKLFYQKIGPEGQVTVIYDGARTFDYDTHLKDMRVNAGLKFVEMYAYPVPGAAVPHVALLQEAAETPTSRGLFVKGDMPTMNAGGVGIQYQRGEVTLTDDAGKTRISGSTGFLDRNFLSERWESSKGQPFQGVVIAPKIRLAFYDPFELIPEGVYDHKPFQPATVTEYRLISADTSLGPSQFDPAAHLSPGDQVGENTPGTPRAFRWHPGMKLD